MEVFAAVLFAGVLAVALEDLLVVVEYLLLSVLFKSLFVDWLFD